MFKVKVKVKATVLLSGNTVEHSGIKVWELGY